MKTVPIVYTVRGTGPFPIDMLREDGSSPYSEQDSERIGLSLDERQQTHYDFQITLIKHNGYQHSRWNPNSAKWKSFGWEVISVEEKRT